MSQASCGRGIFDGDNSTEQRLGFTECQRAYLHLYFYVKAIAVEFTNDNTEYITFQLNNLQQIDI